MPELTTKKDFVEVEFVARQDGNIFDTNIPSEAKKLNADASPKPMVACIGEGLVVRGFDSALEDKEIGKKYNVKLQPEEAYGKRDSSLIKLIPKKSFTDNRMNPVAGATVLLDNMLAKIISSSGGRVLVDFNNPLAGKEVEYEFTIKRKIGNIKEKVDALQSVFFRQVFPCDIDEQAKKIIFKDLQLLTIVNIFKDKFREILGFDVEIFAEKKKEEKPKEAEKEEKQEEKREENQNTEEKEEKPKEAEKEEKQEEKREENQNTEEKEEKIKEA